MPVDGIKLSAVLSCIVVRKALILKEKIIKIS